MKLNEFVKNVQHWAVARNLDVGDPKSQYLKVVEEVGEIASGLAKGNEKMIKDGIGDVAVTLVILAERCGVAFDECLRIAWDEIKDRKGLMVDGVFIKYDDLNKQQMNSYLVQQAIAEDTLRMREIIENT